MVWIVFSMNMACFGYVSLMVLKYVGSVMENTWCMYVN